MLILRAVGTLFLGLQAVALDNPTLSQGGSFVENLKDDVQWTVEFHEKRLSSNTQRKARQDRGDETAPLLRVCEMDNGRALACRQGFSCCVSSDGQTACCPNQEGGNTLQSLSAHRQTMAASFDSTVFVTQTITNTVTSFTGVPITGVVIVTRTEFLTFIDPSRQTQTSTVTVTSFFKRAKRTFGASLSVTPTKLLVTPSSHDLPRPLITQIPKSGAAEPHSLMRKQAEERDVLTLTSTVMVTTTVFVDASRLTITNIVYATTVIAPNAIATVFVTTTVRLPSASTSVSVPTSTSRVSSTEEVPTASTATSSATTEPTSTPTLTSSLTSSSPSSSSTSTFTSDSPSATSTTLTSSTTIETMDPMLTPTSSPTPTLVSPPPSTPRSLSRGQIIGLVLGILFGIILLILAAIFFRRLVIRRRRIQAQMRQKLVPPTTSAPAPVVPTGPSSGGSSEAYSGLTGEGEVRVVIRPVPKRRTQSSQAAPAPAPQEMIWPMPPGYDQRVSVSGFPIFIEEENSDEEMRGEREWSIVSERGSPSPTLERPVTQGTSLGTRRSGATGESFPGLGTLLTPPPPVRNNNNNNGYGEYSDVLPLGGRSSSSSEGEGERRRVVRETMGGFSGGGGEGEGIGGGSLGVGRAW
ncbi:hypothetical protein QBC38DRAFT_410639 [Podospora fimiseda]|uniref:Mid2 domain-containing protein n=1 Tax=Podospora fimiseda TaxID=252190 RepID=A0AAN7GZK4_9PEZI|nr:hypothetical protein QBC38DRAFT_410639 [Podospora fimiseda]